jgi:hypothetical protein
MRVISKLAFTAAALGFAASPVAAANTSLTNLTESQNFTAIQSTIKYTRLSGTSATSSGNYGRATSQVKYNHATGSYTVRDTGSLAITSTFGPANVTSSAGAFTNYAKGPNETLRLYNPGTPNQGVALSYTGYGQWRRTGAPAYGPGTGVNDTYFVYGIKTPAANIQTGTASYGTALDGTFTNKDGVYAVTGTGTLSANFGAGTIAYSATATGARESDSAALAFGSLSGAGTIARASSSFQGTGSVNGSGYRMDVNGYFFGPGAAEVGGVFRLTGNGGNGQGAMVGVD